MNHEPSRPRSGDPADTAVASDVALEHVTFGYDDRPVIEDATFSVARGDFVCVVGPNGGGKTTLLKLLLGILRPQRGRVEVLGRDPVQARRHVGYMPQHSHFDQQFPVTAFEVVLMGRLGRGHRFGPYRRSDKEQAARALREVEAYELRSRPFAALSGGQRQRVLIARALACEPRLLLLDEPTANLDVAVEQEFYALLRRLNEKMTILVVSHDLSFVSRYVRSVLCVRRRVHVHPTTELGGDLINAVYGRDVRMVRHDHHEECSHGQEPCP